MKNFCMFKPQYINKIFTDVCNLVGSQQPLPETVRMCKEPEDATHNHVGSQQLPREPWEASNNHRESRHHL